MAYDDDDPPEPSHDHDFASQFEVIIRPRARRAASALPPLPAPEPPRAALPQPLTPFPDPIPHVMPHGSISTLSGASGVGKTALLATWIRAFQDGAPINGHAVNRPCAIGMLAVDRPWRDHAQWFAKAGCRPFPYYSLRDAQVDWKGFRDWKRAQAMFAQHVDMIGLPPGALLIVDPLPLYIPGDLNKYKDVAIGMAELDEVLRARQLTMLGVFHVSKQKGNPKDNYLRPQDRILGSGGQIGYSETAMYLMSPEEGNRSYYEVGWIPHQIKAESFMLRRDDQGLFVPCDALDVIHDQNANEDKALACFSSDTQVYSTAVLTAQIMKACGCQDRHAKDLITRLVDAQRIVKVRHGHYRRAS